MALTAFADALARLAPFESAPTLCIAVSGGADSMALTLLAHHWASKRHGKIIALTVDHRLRSESRREAEQVHAWLTQRNIEHHILTWDFEVEETNTQASARAARYQLLTDWCITHGILHLLTAHHQDDQAETILQRLARGSGLEGLCGISPLSYVNGTRLLRPLLSVPKAMLKTYLKQSNQPWVEDPSNADTHYDRNKLRVALHTLEDAETLSARVNTSVTILQDHKTLWHHLLTNAAIVSTHIYPEGYAEIHLVKLASYDDIIRTQLFKRVIMVVSGATTPPRQENIQQHMPLLQLKTPDTTRTLHGCILHKNGNYMRISREPAALQGPIPAISGISRWDSRFNLYYEASDEGTDTSLTWRALGADGLRLWKEQSNSNILPYPASVMVTFPALWMLDTLLAIPHIRWVAQSQVKSTHHVTFRPKRTLV